ncbi:MAG TPA: trigger factor [Pyrinomonadaceae bacterium]|nr:trigger factor [Pyrinomonadaceae bacterium]
MKTELKEVSPTQREIKIEVDADTLKEAYGRISQKYAKRANVPGFRKGYAPLDVVRLRFKEEIKNEVLADVLPVKVTEAIQEYKLNPLTEPHLHFDDHENIKVNGSQPISLHVHIEVMPEISEPKYEGMEVTRRVKPVDDSEIEDLIANRLQRDAALIPVEGRKSEIGDTVIADLEGTFDDDPNGEPITATDLEVVLGDEVIEKSFTENLVGVEEDEEKEFTVTYPVEFSSPALAGKTVHYKAKIKSVGKTETPELNDEWAQTLEEGYESLADLRKKLRDDLEKYAETDADARLRNNVIAKVIEQNEFEVPNTLIESQARNLLNNFAEDLQNRGVNLKTVQDDFVQMAYHQMRTQAERDVRGAMLLEKIGEKEKVEVTSEEVDEEIGKMAEYYRTTADEIRKTFEKQGSLDNVKNNLRTRKAIEALIAKAKVIDGPWVDEHAEPITEKEKAEKKKPAKKSAKKTETAETVEPEKKEAKKKTAKSEA